MARIAPGEDLQTAVRSLGSAIVTAARLAADADRVLRDTNRKALARDLAEARDSAHISDRHLRTADALARRITALEALEHVRRTFGEGAREIEPRLARVREQLFEARLSPEKIDDLIGEVGALRERVQNLSSCLHDPYTRASSQLVGPSKLERGRATRERAVGEQGLAQPEVVPIPRLPGLPRLPDHLQPGGPADSDRRH
jgi:hypothetical protein